jgi:hypothetical protein
VVGTPVVSTFSKAGYFSPFNPTWFLEWRSEVLQTRRPGLFAETDPNSRSVPEISEALTRALLEQALVLDVLQKSGQSHLKEPVVRALINLVILNGLELLIPSHSSRIAFFRLNEMFEGLRSHSPPGHAMTFQMSIIRYRSAWQSIKSIAGEHDISPAHLAYLVGLVGSHSGARWLHRVIGLSSTSAGSMSF